MSSLIDPDCRQGKHQSCAGGVCECACHEQDTGTAGPLYSIGSVRTGVLTSVSTPAGIRLELFAPNGGDLDVIERELQAVVAGASSFLREAIVSANRAQDEGGQR